MQLFDKIKESQPEVLQKVFAVKGDITMEGLGLSDEDEARLADEVNVLFHAAATINFTVSCSSWPSFWVSLTGLSLGPGLES